MMNKLSDRLYRTTDLNLAATIMSSGHNLKDINTIGERQLEFIFATDSEIPYIENQYWKDELMVKARTLADNIKFLKSRVYSIHHYSK